MIFAPHNIFNLIVFKLGLYLSFKSKILITDDIDLNKKQIISYNNPMQKLCKNPMLIEV